MDLGLSEEQELLKNSAREFLEKECPEEHVRAMEEDETGWKNPSSPISRPWSWDPTCSTGD